jgi:hypothetical protein
MSDRLLLKAEENPSVAVQHLVQEGQRMGECSVGRLGISMIKIEAG